MKKMTRKQKRALIADAIEISVYGLFLAGFFALLGSLGALEIDRIGFIQFIIQSVLGLIMMLFSAYAYYKIYMEDNDNGYTC